MTNESTEFCHGGTVREEVSEDDRGKDPPALVLVVTL